MGLDISKAAIAAFKRDHGLDSIDRLSAKQFRELQKYATSTDKGVKGKQKRFAFSYHVETLQDGRGYRVTLDGRHYSQNDYNAFGLRQKIAYKCAIKSAMEEFWLCSGRKPFRTFQRADIIYNIHLVRSRDHDNNGCTIKPFQDTFTTLGLIADDRRSVIDRPPEEEIPDGSYRIVATITEKETR